MDTIEVCKIRVDLKHPVALCYDDGSNIYSADRSGQERLVLQPSDDIV